MIHQQKEDGYRSYELALTLLIGFMKKSQTSGNGDLNYKRRHDNDRGNLDVTSDVHSAGVYRVIAKGVQLFDPKYLEKSLMVKAIDVGKVQHDPVKDMQYI